MRFDLLPTLALAFYGATFAAEKILPRGRRVKAGPDRGSLAATLYRIRVEEEALRAHFGEEYAAYARATKRLVPGIY